MEKLPARAGWLWIRQGFALFRRQPGGLSTLFLGYMFLMLAAGMLPQPLGQILPVLLVPAFSMAFMQACVRIEHGQRVLPTLLFSGFRAPVFPPLAALGLLYVLSALCALGLSALVDDGVLWKLATNQIDAKDDALREANVGGAILFAIALYLPAAMGFCFAAPLIYWQKMSVGKAVFFSFFSVLHAIKAFILFAAAWFGITLTASKVVMLLLGHGDTAMTAMLPLSMLLTVIMHCSFYAAYRQIFGMPEPRVPLDKPAA